MELKLLNVVVFAEKYKELVKWYKEAFNLDVMLEEEGEYHYTDLGLDNHIIIGITPAHEIAHFPINPRNNSSIMQLEVSNIKTTFNRVKDRGGKILFGPNYEEKHKFYYGGVADIEGNQIWIVEEKK